MQAEAQSPTSLLTRINDGRQEELETILNGCNGLLKLPDKVLIKYNGLMEDTRSTTRLWQKIKFGNGEQRDLSQIRMDLARYTASITLFLNLLSIGSLSRIEEQMENHGSELQELRASLNWATASLQARSGNREESILTSYGDDDEKYGGSSGGN